MILLALRASRPTTVERVPVAASITILCLVGVLLFATATPSIAGQANGGTKRCHRGVHGHCTPAASARRRPVKTVAVVYASQATLSGPDIRIISEPSAVGGSAVSYGWNGTVHFQVQMPADVDTFSLRVRGDRCAGAPAYTVSIDGGPVVADTAPKRSWTTNSYHKVLLAGTHLVDIQYTNAYYRVWPACLRNLYLDDLTFSAHASLAVPSNPPIPSGFVHQAGARLLNGANKPLKLHGVNLGGYLSWEGWMWGLGFDYIGQSAMMSNLARLVGPAQTAQFRSDVYNNYITSVDFKAISAYGLNVARLPFNYHLLEDNSRPFVYKQSGWDVLDRLVSEAKHNNVYLILVMQAAPCAQNMAFVSDYSPPNFLFWSAQCQARTVAMWKAIAARYALENVIAGYDLLGEPVTTDQSLLALYSRITAAIRRVDRHHLLIYEGNDAALSFRAFTVPLDSNEMVSPHDYWWEEPIGNLAENIPTYDAVARTVDAPLYIGEFGQAYYPSLRQQIRIYNADPLIAGWTDWTYKQSPGFPALQTIRESPDAQMLIDWIDNPARPKPTPTQAEQGMSDFINAVKFANTIPDAKMQQTLR